MNPTPTNARIRQVGSGPRPVARAIEILRERWLAAAIVGFVVFAAQTVRLMLATPTYSATATLQFTPSKDTTAGGSPWYFDDTLNAMVQANLVVLKSQSLAQRAATIGATAPDASDGAAREAGERSRVGPIQVMVEEHHAWRPWNVLMRAMSHAPDPCAVEAWCPKPPPTASKGDGARRYVLSVASDGRVAATREGESSEIAEARPAADGSYLLTLDEAAVRLQVVSGEPRGRKFDVEVRSTEELATWIQTGVNPSLVAPSTGVVDVEFLATSAKQAQRGAQAVALTLIAAKTEEALEQSKRRLEWLAIQEKRVHAALEVAESKLDDYTRTNGTTLLDVRSRALIDESARLLAARLTTEEQLAAEKTTLGELTATKDADRVLVLLGASGADAKASALASRLVELEIARGTLTRLGRESEDREVKKADAELAIAREQYEAHVAAIRERGIAVHERAAHEFEARIAQQRAGETEVDGKLKALPDQERTIARLQRDVAAETRVYEQIVGWKEETELAQTSISPGVRILNDAVEQPYRVHPVLTRSLALAAVLALVAASLVAFILHSRDKTLRAPEALERAAGLPLFAAVPAFKSVPRAERKGLVGSLPAVELPGSALAEIYRTLRANLRFAGADHPVHVLAVTSALEQEGKTVTTLNLAAALAGGGSKVVVIDADLRRPSTHTHLGRPIAPGMTDVIEGRKPLAQAIRAFEKGGFDVLHAGGTPEHPGQLLESKAFADILVELRRTYEYVLLDTPPVLAAADASAIFAKLDGVLLLARSGRSTPDAVQAARDRIERVGGRLLGCVFNGFDARKSLARYGYGYGYRATYGAGAATSRTEGGAPGA